MLIIAMRPQTDSQATKRPGFDKKLDRILSVSARVFSKDGYEKASIRKIAAEIGISLAGLYYYVTGKEELLFLIQYRTFSSLLENLKKRIAQVQEPSEKLGIMIENHLEHFVARMDELVVCTHEIMTLEGDYYSQVFEKRKGYFLVTLEIVKEIGKMRPGHGIEPGLATLYLFGMLNWIYMWYDPVRNASLQNLTDRMTQLFLHGFLPR